jgi:hypothetical protein
MCLKFAFRLRKFWFAGDVVESLRDETAGSTRVSHTPKSLSKNVHCSAMPS